MFFIKHNTTISQALDSHEHAPALSTLSAFPSVAGPAALASNREARRKHIYKVSTIPDPANRKIRSSSSFAAAQPLSTGHKLARDSRQSDLRATYSDIQIAMMARRGRIPKYEYSRKPRIFCAGKLRGCKFSQREQSQINRHEGTCRLSGKPRKVVSCPDCGRDFTRRKNLGKHYESKHGTLDQLALLLDGLTGSASALYDGA